MSGAELFEPLHCEPELLNDLSVTSAFGPEPAQVLAQSLYLAQHLRLRRFDGALGRGSCAAATSLWCDVHHRSHRLHSSSLEIDGHQLVWMLS